MKRIKRIVDTGFWSDEKVMEFSPEDKYFWLFLLTNEFTTQLGVYYLPIKKAAFDLGYSEDTVFTLIERFENRYHLIKYSKETSEVALKNYLIYSIVSGGKPVYDCLCKELDLVKDKSLLGYIYNNLITKDIKNDTVKSFVNTLNIYNDNDNDNDNERIVDESWTNRKKADKMGISEKKVTPLRNNVPPKVEWVSDYCRERNNGIDAQRFCDYYTSKGWLIGKTKMKDWQAAVRTWERKNKPDDGFKLMV